MFGNYEKYCPDRKWQLVFLAGEGVLVYVLESVEAKAESLLPATSCHPLTYKQSKVKHTLQIMLEGKCEGSPFRSECIAVVFCVVQENSTFVI